VQVTVTCSSGVLTENGLVVVGTPRALPAAVAAGTSRKQSKTIRIHVSRRSVREHSGGQRQAILKFLPVLTMENMFIKVVK
jgi:hypothetical protein